MNADSRSPLGGGDELEARLRELLSSEPSPHFQARVRAAVANQSARTSRTSRWRLLTTGSSWWWRTLTVGGVAAAVLAAVLIWPTAEPARGRRESDERARHQAEGDFPRARVLDARTLTGSTPAMLPAAAAPSWTAASLSGVDRAAGEGTTPPSPLASGSSLLTRLDERERAALDSYIVELRRARASDPAAAPRSAAGGSSGPVHDIETTALAITPIVLEPLVDRTQ